MSQKDFASKVLGVTDAFWSQVLGGKRNLRIGTARKAAEVLGTPADLWMDGTKEDRRAAWDAWRVSQLMEVQAYRQESSTSLQ